MTCPECKEDIKRMADSLERIESSLNGPQTLMQHRVAAHKRIEESIKWIDNWLKIQEDLNTQVLHHDEKGCWEVDNDVLYKIMNEIKSILLGKPIK